MQLSIEMFEKPRARRRDPSLVAGATLQRFTLIEEVIGLDGRSNWRAKCVCGQERIVRIRDLKSGHRISCGCFGREQSVLRSTTHGHGTRAKTPTYRTWQHMISRCHSPTSDNYPNYGGAGIVVCERWRASFENFLADMGERPEGKTLDRVIGSKGYEPSNCRWATPGEQAQNTTRAKLTVETAASLRAMKGQLSIRAAGRLFGVSSHRVWAVWNGTAWREV